MQSILFFPQTKYAAEGFTEEQKTLLKENNIMTNDAKKLGLTPRENPALPNQ